MPLELTGTIKSIGEIQSFGTKGFTKRDLLLTTQDGKFTQDIAFEFHKERCDLLDKYQEGQEVAVSFDIRGREYNGRHFVTLVAWKLAGIGQAQAQPRHSAQDSYQRPRNTPAQAEGDQGINPATGEEYPF